MSWRSEDRQTYKCVSVEQLVLFLFFFFFFRYFKICNDTCDSFSLTEKDLIPDEISLIRTA